MVMTLTSMHKEISLNVIAAAWLRSLVAASTEMFGSSALLRRFPLALFRKEGR